MPQNYDQEKNNPCLKVNININRKFINNALNFIFPQEQDLSYNCLHKNNFDREKCELYFANYQNCKEFWVNII